MPFKHIKVRQRKSRKKRYRVRNWPDYNQALINRGGLVFMVTDDIAEHWRESPENRKPGGKKCYTDYAIEICL